MTGSAAARTLRLWLTRSAPQKCVDAGLADLRATSRHGLEGIVAKKRSEPYRPGERGWIKVKHRHYWRFVQELERAKGRQRTLG
jgi:ATP-dependent DNA ligase